MDMKPSQQQLSGPAEVLAERIAARKAVVAVVGLGYVGLPLAHTFHSAGMRVIGFDIDESKIASLAAGRGYLAHLGQELVQGLAASERFEGTSDYACLGEADAILVCVPTPLGPHQEPDLSFVLQTAKAIGTQLRHGQLLVLESTTYPGTTREQFLPAVQLAARQAGKHLICGKDYFVAYSPEREDPGRKSHNTASIPRITGGLDELSGHLAQQLYLTCIKEVRTVSSAEVAEASKLLENIFRAVNIAMVNEMKILLEAMGINIWEVIEAASSKPFGFMPFYPGPGLGGHCIPIDPFYLAWRAKELGHSTRFIELAGKVNTEMPSYVIERLTLALNHRNKPVKGSRVLVLGLAYKADIDDTRESPSFALIEKLTNMGAKVEYSDPHIPKTVPVRKHDLQMTSVVLSPMAVASYDAVLLATAHSAFDYEMLAKHTALLVDTRNALAPYSQIMGERLVRA
jgi:UDP-N-acetyl-D-glucosamine dehydrogenase